MKYIKLPKFIYMLVFVYMVSNVS